MGAAASVEEHKGKPAEEIAAVVKGLSEAELAHLTASFGMATCPEATAANRKSISENEANIHAMHIAVTSNKLSVYEERARIEENRDLILANYQAAFKGNRLMANQNTDDIYKNRFAILDALKVEGPVQENFCNSKYNESSIEFINNRCLLNNRVAKVNVMMSDANEKLIEINNMILEGNEEIVTYNTAQIETNRKFLEAGIMPEKCTPEANAERIESNGKKIAAILERNTKYNGEAASRDAAISENHDKIMENARLISQRRTQIKENRQGILTNGTQIQANLAVCGSGGKSRGVTAALRGLGEDDMKKIADALAAPVPANEKVEENRKNICQNEAALHKLHLEVMTNKEKLYAVRSLIEENRLLVLKNYTGAFVCNRQCANQNTDDIFKNRMAILDTLKIEDPIQENFRNSKYNEANIEWLENRSKLNNRVAKVNVKLSEANKDLIAINSKIMEGNEEIVNFNTAAIKTNANLLEAGVLPEKCTPEANLARINANADSITLMQGKAGKYDMSVDKMLERALANREKINKQAEAIRDRRHRIKENRKNLLANAEKIAELIKNQ